MKEEITVMKEEITEFEKVFYYHLSYFANWLEDKRFDEKYFDDEKKAVNEAKRMKKLGADNINLSKCYKQKIVF